MVYPLDYRFLCFMGMIYIMLIVSLIMAVFFLIIFMWAAKTGQYEDDYAPSVRVLYDDEQVLHNQNQNKDGNTNSTVRQ